MKKLYICVSLFFIFGIIFFNIVNNEDDEYLDVKETYFSLPVTSNSYIKEINEENEKNKVLIYYPQTEYELLNIEITNFIKLVYSEHNKKVNELNIEMPRKAELSINFDSYEYKDYVSYVFNTSEDILMAHPKQNIYTINYNVKENRIISINDLQKYNPNILNVLSKYCYEILSQNKSIIEYDSLEYLKEGTSPNIENFRNIAFTKSGLMVLFEHYSVGPYVLGEFSVTVPYDKII